MSTTLVLKNSPLLFSFPFFFHLRIENITKLPPLNVGPIFAGSDREADSKRLTKKDFVKIFYRGKIL